MVKLSSQIVIAAAVAAAFQSQQAIADPQLSAGAGAQSSNQIEEVVVTAERRAQSLEKVPVAVSALSARALEQRDIHSEDDLQVAVPGLLVKAGQYNNQLNYSLRGQTVDAFTSSRPSVLPYVNNVAVGGAGDGASATQFYDLESVQVLKGPQGTLFGRNSTGGAVLFTTRKPTNDFGGYATVRGGNYGDFELEGALNVPIVSDKVLLRVAGFYQTRNGFQYDLFDKTTRGTVRNRDVRVSLTIKPVAKLANYLVVDFASSGGNNLSSVVYNTIPSGYPYAPAIPAGFLYSPSMDLAFGPGAWAAFLAAHPGTYPGGLAAFAMLQKSRGPFLISVDAPSDHQSTNWIVTNTTVYDVAANTQIKNIFGYTHLLQVNEGEFDGTSYPIDSNGPVSGGGRGGPMHQLSDELQLLGKMFGDKLTYVTGLYYADEELHTHSLSVIADLLPFAPPVNQINDGVQTDTVYAGYAHGTLDISEFTGISGLAVQAGGRFSSEKVGFLHLPDDVYMANTVPVGAVFHPQLTDTFDSVSWQLGVNEQLNPDTLLYVVSRRGFRSGGFNFFAPPLAGFGDQGGSEYKPERATDVEIGAKFQGDIGDMPIRLNIAAYDTWIENIQRSNYVSIFGSLAGITVNVPKAEVKGIEIDGLVKPTSWLEFGGTLNTTDAKFTDNIVSVLQNPTTAFGPYADTPKWSGSIYAELTAPLTTDLVGSLRADLYSQSSFYFSSTGGTLNPGSQAPGYTIANFHVGIESANGWSLTANVKNAFDKVYYAGGIGYISLFADNTVVPGAPRTFTVEARYDF